MLSLVDLEPGAVVAPHQHPHEQLGIWLAGDAEAVIGDCQQSVRAGDSYYIPGDTLHTFVAGPQGGRASRHFQPAPRGLPHAVSVVRLLWPTVPSLQWCSG